MNIYYIDAGTQTETVWEDIEAYAGHYDYYEAVALIAASTRGKAKRQFLFIHDNLEWTDKISIRLIERDMDMPEGEVDDQTLWLQAYLTTHGPNDAEEYYTWQYLHEDGELSS